MKKINLFALAALFVGSMLMVSCGGPSEGDLNDAISELNNLAAELEEEAAVIETEVAAGKFHSEDGKFKIIFSGEPTHTPEIIPTEIGDIKMHMFMYEKSITEAEMVAYNDYPSAMVDLVDADQMLQDAKKGSVESLGATITEEKVITYNGHKGLEFKANSSQYYVNYKVFIVKNRLYQIALMRDGSYAVQDDVDNFFNSFELIEE